MTKEEKEEERTLFTEMVTIQYGTEYPITMKVEAMVNEMETMLPKNYDLQDMCTARGIVVAHHIVEEDDE